MKRRRWMLLVALLLTATALVWLAQRKPDVRVTFARFEKWEGYPTAIFIVENRSGQDITLLEDQPWRVFRPVGREEHLITDFQYRGDYPRTVSTGGRLEIRGLVEWKEPRFREPFQVGVYVLVPQRLLALLPSRLYRALPKTATQPKVLTYWSEVVTP